MTSQLPKKLENCPIVDSVVEIRFKTSMVTAAVFGLLYENFRSKFSKVEELPVLHFPKNIRDQDPNLTYSPHYRLTSETFMIQIGPRALTVSPKHGIGNYPGWEVFFGMVTEAFHSLFTQIQINTIERIGIRYTNFFNTLDIYKKLNLSIQYQDNPIPFEKTLLRTNLTKDGFSSTLQVSNDAARNEPGRSPMLGSIIDIDTFKLYTSLIKEEEVLRDVNSAHEIEKTIFWDLLNDSFKSELKPIF